MWTCKFAKFFIRQLLAHSLSLCLPLCLSLFFSDVELLKFWLCLASPGLALIIRITANCTSSGQRVNEADSVSSAPSGQITKSTSQWEASRRESIAHFNVTAGPDGGGRMRYNRVQSFCILDVSCINIVTVHFVCPAQIKHFMQIPRSISSGPFAPKVGALRASSHTHVHATHTYALLCLWPMPIQLALVKRLAAKQVRLQLHLCLTHFGSNFDFSFNFAYDALPRSVRFGIFGFLWWTLSASVALIIYGAGRKGWICSGDRDKVSIPWPFTHTDAQTQTHTDKLEIAR